MAIIDLTGIVVHQNPGWVFTSGGLDTTNGHVWGTVSCSDGTGWYGYTITVRLIYENNTYSNLHAHSGTYSEFSFDAWTNCTGHTTCRLGIHCTSPGCDGFGGYEANVDPGFTISNTWSLNLTSNPRILDLRWDSDSIAEDSISYVFVADKSYPDVRIICRLLSDDGNTEIARTEEFHPDVTYRTEYQEHTGRFTVPRSTWNEITYAKRYSIILSIYNENGEMNEGDQFTRCSSYTKNHVPQISLNIQPHLDWYHVDWSSDVPVEYYSGYPSSSAGSLNHANGSGGTSGSFRFNGVQPNSNITSWVRFVSARRFTEDHPTKGFIWGDYANELMTNTVRTLTIASATMGTYTFGNDGVYSLTNRSERACTATLIAGGSTLWTDSHTYNAGSQVSNKTHVFTQNELDTLYKKLPNNGNSVAMTLRITTSGAYGTYTSSVNLTCNLTGNAMTARVGVNNAPRRVKCWIGVNGTPRRCVAWIGIDGKGRRSI